MMALKDWKKRRSKNPYKPYSWINIKTGRLLDVHYDIGFGKQRNVTIWNYRKQLLSGYEHIHTSYFSDEKSALKFAKSWMRKH